MNLREVLRKYGHNVGLNIKAVRLYAHQLFLALSHMRKCNIIHADLKPDNILANTAKNVIKICDLGSASDASENDITPYLVSRFYRAPEISMYSLVRFCFVFLKMARIIMRQFVCQGSSLLTIDYFPCRSLTPLMFEVLGLSYDFAVDMWSAACTLYELSTGKILFPGRSNNQMLKLHMELKGKLSHKMIKRGLFGAKYFDNRWNFCAIDSDKVTGKDVVRPMQFKGPTRDLKSRLSKSAASTSGADSEELRMISHFIDLLDKCLQLNPEKRITPLEALRHPFITGKSAKINR
jgi:serine/threonine-protein kinase PRP4